MILLPQKSIFLHFIFKGEKLSNLLIRNCSGYIIVGGDEIFDEFMQLYSNHPHSADVFELIDQYEEVFRNLY